MAAAVLCAALVSSCGGQDDEQVASAGSPSASADPGGGEGPQISLEEEREFAACMREKGVNYPDPNADGSPSASRDFDYGVDEETLMRLFAEC